MNKIEVDKLVSTIEILDEKIQRAYPFADRDYVIFGSASLVMRGILDRLPGDIDVFMTRKLWGALLADTDWHVETPKATHPPILVNAVTPITINAFFDWENPFAKMNVEHELNIKEYIRYANWSYPVMPVDEALRIKVAAAELGGHTKHIPDIEIIEQWLVQ